MRSFWPVCSGSAYTKNGREFDASGKMVGPSCIWALFLRFMYRCLGTAILSSPWLENSKGNPWLYRDNWSRRI